MIVRADVKDYDEWKAGFDNARSFQDSAGVRHLQVLRDPDNKNTVIVLHHFDTLEDARAFAANPALAEAMKNGGVIGHPRIEIFEVI